MSWMGYAPSKQHSERRRVNSQRQVGELDGRVVDDDARRGIRSRVLSRRHRDLGNLRMQQGRLGTVVLSTEL